MIMILTMITFRTYTMAANNTTKSINERQLSLISFNMHGYNQGSITLRDLQCSCDVFLLQEHWLTPNNLGKFNEDFPEYTAFGSSAMVKCVETGILRGRPFGGVMILLRNNLNEFTETLCATERLVIIRLGNALIANIYLPCVGTSDRDIIIYDTFENIAFWSAKYPDNMCIVGGDFNTDLDSIKCVTSAHLRAILAECYLHTFDGVTVKQLHMLMKR